MRSSVDLDLRRGLCVACFVVACVLMLGVLAVGAVGAGAAGYQPGCEGLESPPFCGSLSEPFGIAVDESGNLETTGDVYEVSLGGRLARFNAYGEPAPFSGLNVNISGNDLGGFSFLVGVAVASATGDFYVTDREGAKNVVEEFSPAGEPEGSFTLPPSYTEVTGIAVDNSGGASAGDLWIANSSATPVVAKFSPAGVLLSEITSASPAFTWPYSVAVGRHGNVYVANDTENVGGDVEEFSESGVFERVVNEEQAQSVAVDPLSGEVFVADQRGNQIQPYTEAGVALPAFGAGTLNGFTPGLAVDGADHFVYATNYGAGRGDIYGGGSPPEQPLTGEATEVTHYTAALHGVVNPSGAGEGKVAYRFYFSAAGACTGGGHTAGVGLAVRDHEAVTTEVAGLEPATQYKYCLVASNASGSTAGGEQTFTTSAVPVVGGESFSDVGSASVTLEAAVDDYGVSGVSYYYEYGTSSAYGSTTPPLSLGAAKGEVGAPVTVNGLRPATVYHFRVVVADEHGTARGADMEFRTLIPGFVGLPDGRVYEMVTPPDNYDADVYVPLTVKNLSESSFEFPGLAGNTAEEPFQAAAGGDAVAYLGDPTTGGDGGEGRRANQYLATRSPQGGWTQVNIQPVGYLLPEYTGFSSELSTGVLESPEPLVAGVPTTKEPDEYAYVRRPGSESYQALDEVFVGRVNEVVGNGFAGGNAGTSTVPAFSHVLTYGSGGLTDATGGRLLAVNILPNGETAPDAVFGAPQVFSSVVDGPDFDRVISGDGSRIVWTDRSTGALYVRENDTQPPSPLGPGGECTVAGDACTVQVDAGSSGGALFWTASSDGSKVFFTDCSRLTASSTAVFTAGCGAEAGGRLSGSDLYEYDLSDGELTDLTVDRNASDLQGANVQGVVGASEDGEYVYFVATGNLAAGASAGEPNLYVVHGGVITFMTTLSYGDYSYGSGLGGFSAGVGVWEQSLADRTSEVAPDGSSLVFEAGGEVYHDALEGGKGHLVCVSCSPSAEVSSLTAPVAVGAEGGFLPVTGDASNNTYQPRWISDDGSRVFFESSQALVPQDVNGLQDVYEWERDGSGSCRESPGCIYLLSGGTSTAYSTLLDASSSGDDVFIITRAQLTPEDENDEFNVFDARVGGARPLVPQACSGSGCQGVPAVPPVFATPSSVTFNGVGNFPRSVEPVAKPKPKPKQKSRAKTKGRHGAKAKRRRAKRKRGLGAGGRKARRVARRNGTGETGRGGR
jgi:hypothetical protein